MIYIPLHLHTEYSFLDGISKLPDIVSKAKELEMNSIAISDHNISGVVSFYFECVKNGIKPILGVEMYINDRPEEKIAQNSKTYHMVVLAKNYQGYKDLMSIYTEAATDFYYYRPRTSLEKIKQKMSGQNFIVSTACIGGKIPQLLLAGKTLEAEEELSKMQEIFGRENVFLEMMPFNMGKQKELNLKLYELSKKMETQFIITTDAHYIEKSDAEIQKILSKVSKDKNTGEIKKGSKLEFETDMCYMMSGDEIIECMTKYHPDIPKDEVVAALERTVKISGMCDNYDIAPKELQMPEFELPDGMNADQYLRKLCYDVFPKIYGEREDAKERLEYELGVIAKLNYSSYFLIVWDMIKYARDIGASVGPGRGSAAGCLVSYLLGIVRVDPLRWGLFFERFLNPERPKAPDIDIDFSSRHRLQIVNYLREKYGHDKVAWIVTYSRLGIKSAIKDVSRVLGVEYNEVNEVTKKIPQKISIDEAMVLPDVVSFSKKHPRVFEIVKKVANLPRNTGKHAAGVVVTPKPIYEYASVSCDTKAVDEDAIPVIQIDMGAIGKMKLLKIDCLVVDGIDLVGDVCDEIKNNWGVEITPDMLDRADENDEEVYKIMRKGLTYNTFQFGTFGMQKMLRKIQPTCFNDLIACNALQRPGPLSQGFDNDYAQRKRSPSAVSYVHPEMKDIIGDTYGLILYQEQIMLIVSHYSEISFGESDLFRRHLENVSGDEKTKKEHEVWRQKFIQGAINKGYNRQLADKIFNWVSSAGYSFNKSHSTAYSKLGYQTAWLKTHFFVEFMAKALNIAPEEYMQLYVKECYDKKFPVLPVDVNRSKLVFSSENKNSIRTGFTNVKGIGEPAALAVMNNSLEVPGSSGYRDMIDFFFYNMKDMKVVKRILPLLVYSGGFDCLTGGNRKAANIYVDVFIDAMKELKKIKDVDGFKSFFAAYLKHHGYSNEEELLKIEDDSYEKRARLEEEYVRFKFNYTVKPIPRKNPDYNLEYVDATKNNLYKKLPTEKKCVNILKDKTEARRKKMGLQTGNNYVKFESIDAQDDGFYVIRVSELDSGKIIPVKLSKKYVSQYKDIIKKVKAEKSDFIINVYEKEDGKKAIKILEKEDAGGEEINEPVANGESTEDVKDSELENKAVEKVESAPESWNELNEAQKYIGYLMVKMRKTPMYLFNILFLELSENPNLDIEIWFYNNNIRMYVENDDVYEKCVKASYKLHGAIRMKDYAGMLIAGINDDYKKHCVYDKVDDVDRNVQKIGGFLGKISEKLDSTDGKITKEKMLVVMTKTQQALEYMNKVYNSM